MKPFIFPSITVAVLAYTAYRVTQKDLDSGVWLLTDSTPSKATVVSLGLISARMLPLPAILKARPKVQLKARLKFRLNLPALPNVGQKSMQPSSALFSRPTMKVALSL